MQVFFLLSIKAPAPKIPQLVRVRAEIRRQVALTYHPAWRLLGPPSGIESGTLPWKHWVLTTEPLGNSLQELLVYIQGSKVGVSKLWPTGHLSVFINKILWNIDTLIYLIDCLLLYLQNWVVVIGIIWPASLKFLLSSPLRKSLCTQRLIKSSSYVCLQCFLRSIPFALLSPIFKSPVTGSNISHLHMEAGLLSSLEQQSLHFLMIIHSKKSILYHYQGYQVHIRVHKHIHIILKMYHKPILILYIRYLLLFSILFHVTASCWILPLNWSP